VDYCRCAADRRGVLAGPASLCAAPSQGVWVWSSHHGRPGGRGSWATGQSISAEIGGLPGGESGHEFLKKIHFLCIKP